MKCVHATSLLTEVDQTISVISALNISDPILLSYLAKYLVVYICGIYEESIEWILKMKFSRIRSKYISNYLVDNIKYSFRNPEFENIVKLLGKFNNNWVEKVKGLPPINKDAITSIVTNKNHLAHEGTSSITWSEAVQHYTNSRTVIEKIDSIVLGQ